MKSKSIFLLAISIGCGLLAVIGLTQVMGRSKTPTQPKVEMVPVLVTVADLDALTPLTPEHVAVEKWPLENVPEGVASSMEDIEGMVIKQRLGKDYPISLDDLVSEKDANRLAIPPGYKVVGIKVSAADHIDGLLQPGDRVDVIGIFRSSGNNAEPISQTFLKRIRVFSVNANMTAKIQRDEKNRSSTVVSVLATEKQANQLVLVQRVAELKLVLLGKSDSEEDEVNDQELADDGELNGFMSLSKILNGDDQAQGLTKFLQNQNEDESASNNAPMQEHTMVIHSANGSKTYRFGSNGELQNDSQDNSQNKPSNPEDEYEGFDEDEDSSLFDDEDGIESDD